MQERERATAKRKTNPLTEQLGKLLAELKRGTLRCQRCGRTATCVRMIGSTRAGHCNGGDCREAADLNHRVAMLKAARNQARRR
jgi:hypothetical protein